MTAPLGDAWQLAGFMLFSDVDHYVKFDVVADNDPGAREGASRRAARTRTAAALTGPGGQDIAPPASATDTWWLRLTKKGNTYTGAISADGTTWVQAPGSVTVALNNPAIGLMAIGPAQAAPIDVDFEFFQHRRGRHGGSDDDAHAARRCERCERLARDQPDADAGHRGRRDDGVQARRRRLDQPYTAPVALDGVGHGLLPVARTRRATSRRPRP